MMNNITIGQYFPGNSIVHRLDPRVKLVLTLAFVIVLFLANNLVSLGICILFVIFIYLLSRIPLVMSLKSIKAVLPVILFTAIINMFFIDGTIIFKLWFLEITQEGLRMSIMMTARIIALIVGTSLLTYTTSPISLTDGIERLFSPLKRFKVPVHEVAMMMTIALRFIPTLIEETNKIMSAQKARGADMESGNFLQRIRALLPILIPLFVSAFRRADELALAMESRCYHGGEGRTRLHETQMGGIDIVALAVMTLFLVGVIVSNKAFAGLY